MFRVFRKSFLFFLPVWLAACAVPAMREPAGIVPVSEKFNRLHQEEAAGESVSLATEKWWESYGSADLNALIEEALEDNPDLNQTRARLQQALALSRGALADLLPFAEGGVSRASTRGDTKTPSSFTLSGAAGFEIDLWGKNLAGFKADSWESRASLEDLRSGAITLAASVAESWVSLMALREEEALVNRQLEAHTALLDLQYKRFSNAAAGAVEVLQQKESLARIKDELSSLLAEQDVTEHQIAILTGSDPSAPPEITGATLPPVLPLAKTGLPAQLLARRPDIQAAWKRLRSADWAVGEAKMDRLPALDLTAGYSSSGAALSDLTKSWLVDLAASLTMPVLDGGRRRAAVRRTEALADERLHAYKEVVLAALKEVEDSLSRNRHGEESLVLLKEQEEALRNSLEQAKSSYAHGHQDYSAVLKSLLEVEDMERQRVQGRKDLALERIGLQRALGFSAWTDFVIAGDADG